MKIEFDTDNLSDSEKDRLYFLLILIIAAGIVAGLGYLTKWLFE